MNRPFGSFHIIGMISDTNMIRKVDNTMISMTIPMNFSVNKGINLTFDCILNSFLFLHFFDNHYYVHHFHE